MCGGAPGSPCNECLAFIHCTLHLLRWRWQAALSFVPTADGGVSRDLFKRAARIVLEQRAGSAAAAGSGAAAGITDTQVDVIYAMFDADGARGCVPAGRRASSTP